MAKADSGVTPSIVIAINVPIIPGPIGFGGTVPQWLLNGLSVAGGMLPAIGFAMIMSVMLKKELIPFAILGYVLAAYLQLPVIGIALVGAVFAIKHYNDSEKKQVVTTTAQGGEQDDWI